MIQFLQDGGETVRNRLPHLQGKRSLAGCRWPVRQLEELADRVEATQPAEANRRENDGVQIAPARFSPCHPAEAGVDIAADILHIEIRPCGKQLGGAARRSGTNFGTIRERADEETVAGDQCVTGISSLRDRADSEAGNRAGWQVFEGVDDQVAIVREERFTQRAGEDSCSAEGSQRLTGNVASGRD